MRTGLAEVYATDRIQLLERVRLIAKPPALRARLWDNQVATQRLLARGGLWRGAVVGHICRCSGVPSPP
jgi:hypothetical protein